MWWALSFAVSGKNLGVVVVRARGFLMAHRVADLLGVNPGGEILGFELGPSLPAVVTPDMTSRLMTKEEMEAIDAAAMEAIDAAAMEAMTQGKPN